MKTKTPQVGIFWYCAKKERLITSSVPLGKGETDHLFINSPEDHSSSWESAKSRFKELKNLEYYDLPRGRVLFVKRERKFIVFLTQVLMSGKIKSLILKEFGLSKSQTEFKTDIHYEEYINVED